MGALRVLFVSLTNDVGTDRIVADVGRAGATCGVLAPAGSYATLVRCVAARFTLPRRGFRAAFVMSAALRDAVRAWRPDRLVPLDDLSATLLRTMAVSPRTPDEVRALLKSSFGQPSGYEAACQRVALALLAAQLDVRTPAFAAASGADAAERIAAELGFPVMVKRDQSSGSGGVVRVETRAQLAVALRFAQLKTVAKTTLARLARVGRPLTPALVQAVVDGRLAMFTAACEDGRLIDGQGFEAVESHPVKRASTILRPLALAEMEEAARRLVAALGCSGFVSFDFMVDAHDRAFLIEMNPRPIGSVHLGRLSGHDLAHAFVTGERAARDGPGLATTSRIALFPKELERDPTGSRIAADPTLLHDIPEHEPVVVMAYIQHLKVEHPAHAAAFDRLLPGQTSAIGAPLPAAAHPTPC